MKKYVLIFGILLALSCSKEDKRYSSSPELVLETNSQKSTSFIVKRNGNVVFNKEVMNPGVTFVFDGFYTGDQIQVEYQTDDSYNSTVYLLSRNSDTLTAQEAGVIQINDSTFMKRIDLLYIAE